MPIGGGSGPYPNLQSIADLFRSGINDTFNNAGGSGTGYGGGAGLIMPNSNPDLLTFMGSAIQELFSDLRNVGDPELIIDNYLLIGLPALAVADPAVQVALSYSGFFNGLMNDSTWTLPSTCRNVLAMWERQAGTGDSFQPMKQAAFGLAGVPQGIYMGQWEMRQGAVWMPGATQSIDLRMRMRIEFPVPLGPNIDFTNTYVPILTSANAIVAKMLILYARRFAPDLYQMAIAEEIRQMNKLMLESVRQMQSQENERAVFGSEAVQQFSVTWSWL